MTELTNFIKVIRKKIRHFIIGHLSYEHKDIEKKIENNKFLLGKIYTGNFKGRKIINFEDVELRIFSQFGEDGIIQYLIQNVKIQNKIFIEIGCGNFEESNTRFLLENNNWKGVIFDKESDHLKFLSSDKGKIIKYTHDIIPVMAQIEPDNVNSEIKKTGLSGDIGLLSIDIDGVDYWVLRSIEIVSPRIIVLEYNSVFGNFYSATIPYSRNFDRMKAHFSGLYFGASLKAFVELLEKKSYVFVGSNSTGNNAFFVRSDVISNIKKTTLSKGYVASKYRESKNKDGNLTYISDHNDRVKLMSEMKLLDLKKNSLFKCNKIIKTSKS